MIKNCQSCNAKFDGRRDAKTCSVRCRKRFQRAKTAILHEAGVLKQDIEQAVDNLKDAVIPVNLTPATVLAGIEPGASGSETGTFPEPSWEPQYLDLPEVSELSTPTASAPASPQIPPPVPPPLTAVPTTAFAAPSLTSAQSVEPELDHKLLSELEVPTNEQLARVVQPSVVPGSIISAVSPSAAPVSTISAVPLQATTPEPTLLSLERPEPQPPITPTFESPPPQSNKLSFLKTTPLKAAMGFTVLIMVLVGGIAGVAKIFNHTQPPGGSLSSSSSQQFISTDNSGLISLNLDTAVAKGKTLTLSQIISGPGASVLQITGDVQSSGALLASGGGSSLSDGGLKINNVIVCTAAGCTSSAQAGNTTRILNGLLATATLQGNSFNGPGQLVQLTGSGLLPVLSGANLTNLDASKIASGSLDDARLSSNVALLNGSPLFKNTTNSTTAFRIQNATGTNLLVVDTTAGTVTVVGLQGSGANLTSLNASNVSSGTLADSRLSANVALLNGTGPQIFTGNNKFTGTFLAQNSSNSATAFAIQNAAGNSNLLIADTTNSRIAIGQATAAYTLDVNGDINSATGIRVGGALLCSASGCTANSGSNNYIQNSLNLQTANFNIQTVANTSVTGIIRASAGQSADLLQLKDSSGTSVVTFGPTGNVLIQPSTNSISAFQVFNANATSHLIGGDTLNARVAIAKPTPPDYTLDVGGDINTTTGLRVAGNLVCSTTCTPGGGSGNYIQNGTVLQTANYAIQSDLNTHIVALIRGASGQSADLLDLVSGDSGANIASFGATGSILLKNSVDSATAFRIQNLGGNNYLLVNTSGATLSLGDTGIASTVQVGNTTGAVAQTINIGNNATAASTNTVVLGSTIGTSPVTIQAGTSGVLVKPANSTTAFQIQSSTGTPLLTADTSGSNLTYAAGNAGNLNITSDLSLGARSGFVAYITQANNATNDNSLGLLQLDNEDTGSTSSVLQVIQKGTNGTGITVSNVTGGTAYSAGGVTSGTGLSLSGLTSGSGINVGTGNNLSTGVGLQYNVAGTVLTSGSALRVTGSASGGLAAYTGNLIDIQPARTLTAGSINDSGRLLYLNRGNTVNNVGNTFTVSGDVATIASNCIQTAGTCTDTGSVLNLNQQYASASGAVLKIQGAGTGNLLQVTDTTAAAQDVLTIADEGATTFKNRTNSTTAFQIQNVAGNNYLLVNTSGASVSVGDTGIASTVQVGNTTGAVAQTINIGNNATASSTSTITIGSTIAGATTLQSQGGVFFNNPTGTTYAQGDASNRQFIIGSGSSTDGKLVFRNATNGNSAIIQSGVTSGSYTIKLPTAGPALSQCLQNDGSTIGQLTFAACTTGSTLQTAYTNSTGSTTPEIKLDTTRNGVDIQDADTTIGSSQPLFAVRASNSTGLGAGLFTVGNTGATVFQNSTDSTTAFQIQNAVGNSNLFMADTTNSRIGIGATAPTTTSVQISLAGVDTTNGSIVKIDGTLSSTTNGQAGLRVAPNIAPGSASTKLYNGITTVPISNSTNLTSGSLAGIFAGPYYYGTGTIGNVYGGWFQNQLDAAGIISNSFGIYVQDPFKSAGTITKNAGLDIDNQTKGTNNTNLLIGTNAIPTGNYSIYNSSSYNNYFGGATTVQTSAANSTTAFQIQNTNAANLFDVDTSTTTNLLSDTGSMETGITGWTAKGSATIAQNSANQYQGYDSLAITTTASGDGAYYSFTLSASTQYTLSFWTKGSTGGSLIIGRQDQSGTNVDCSSTTFYNIWFRNICTFTTGGTISSSNIYIKQNDATARTLYIDAVQLETGAVARPYNYGGIQFSGLITSPVAIRPLQASTDAFSVAADSIRSLIVNSNDKRVGINIAAASAPQNTLSVNTLSNNDTLFQLAVGTSSASNKGIVVQGVASQTGNLFEAQNSSGTALFSIGATGAAVSQNSSNSTTAFQVQNSSSAAMLTVDTTNGETSLHFSATTATEKVCGTQTNATASTGIIRDCTGTPGDYAEEYGSTDASIEAADVVALDPTRPAEEVIGKDGLKGSKAWVIKTTRPYQASVLGIISTQPNDLIGRNFTPDENPKPLSLAGRVPVKVVDENGPIMPGDYLTSSSTPGYAMKAAQAGPTIGKALESFSGTGTGKVLVFINISYYGGPGSTISDWQGGSATLDNLVVHANTTTTTLTVSDTATFKGAVTIAGDTTVQGALTLGDHFITTGPAVIVTAEAGAGTDSQGNPNANVTSDGNDQAGTITVTSGSNPTAGILAKITFHKPYGKAPKVILTSSNDKGTDLKYFYNSATDSFTLQTANSPAAATTYIYSYFIIQ